MSGDVGPTVYDPNFAYNDGFFKASRNITVVGGVLLLLGVVLAATKQYTNMPPFVYEKILTPFGTTIFSMGGTTFLWIYCIRQNSKFSTTGFKTFSLLQKMVRLFTKERYLQIPEQNIENVFSIKGEQIAERAALRGIDNSIPASYVAIRNGNQVLVLRETGVNNLVEFAIVTLREREDSLCGQKTILTEDQFADIQVFIDLVREG
ncbi:MAG: hypothetical protein ACKVOH_00345 [Chlamydiales bacterium]